MEMTNKKILTITLLVIAIHFILTSLIGHYISIQIGTQTGQIVANGLKEASKSPQAPDEEAAKIYQNMKEKVNTVNETWKIPSLLISLPAKPLMNSFLGKIRKNQINKMIVKEITREQFRMRGLIIDYAANLLNSLSLGFMAYIILRIVKVVYGKE